MVFMKSGSLFVESSMSWVYGYDPETKSSRYFPYNENPTRALNAISLKCCLPSTDVIESREKIHICVWRFKVASFKRDSLKSTRFSQQKKVGYFCNRVVVYIICGSDCTPHVREAEFRTRAESYIDLVTGESRDGLHMVPCLPSTVSVYRSLSLWMVKSPCPGIPVRHLHLNPVREFSYS